jgi:hypothetical protein
MSEGTMRGLDLFHNRRSLSIPQPKACHLLSIADRGFHRTNARNQRSDRANLKVSIRTEVPGCSSLYRFGVGDLPYVRTVKRSASDILLSTISASISENRKSSRTLSQSRMSSSSFASISQVFGSRSGSDAGSSFSVFYDFRLNSLHMFSIASETTFS